VRPPDPRHPSPHLPPRDATVWRDRIAPALRGLLGTGYFSLAVEGLEHVPRSGPVVYAANHSGWVTVDSFVLGLVLWEALGVERLPYAMVQDEFFHLPGISSFLWRIGGLPAQWLREPEALPATIESFGVHPEGADGNVKPFWQAYQQRPWKTGFVHLAHARRAQVVPVAILGGEEAFPVAWTIERFRHLVGSPIPVPLVPAPLPSRWKIIFHEPLRLDDIDVTDHVATRAAAARVRAIVQGSLERESHDRPIARLMRQLTALARPR
jgi:1-acyl-sn-glycerol-3-phosphate acyltransferase